MDYIIIIFLFIAIISIISMNLMTYQISSIHSNIDERKHLVLNLPFKKTAANIIAAMKKRLDKLVKYFLSDTYSILFFSMVSLICNNLLSSP